MLKIKQTIIVEGKYDKIKLKSITDANIITTNGFGIYNNPQKRALIKNIAEKTGIIILTDSDSAGRRIRNFIKSCAGNENNILNVYAPKIPGREKRKANPSKENIVGVEGTGKDLLIGALKKFGAVENENENNNKTNKQITKTDFYSDGLSGGKDSRKKRGYLCEKLNVPYMPSNALLETVNILTDYDGYKKIVTEYDDRK